MEANKGWVGAEVGGKLKIANLEKISCSEIVGPSPSGPGEISSKISVGGNFDDE